MKDEGSLDQRIAPVQALEGNKIHQDGVNINTAKSEEIESGRNGAHVGGERPATLHLKAVELIDGEKKDFKSMKTK